MNLLSRCLLAALATLPLAVATPAFSQLQSPRPLLLAAGEYASLVSSDYRSPINIRDDASTRAYARHIGYAGDRVEVLDRSAGQDGYMWYFVRFTVSNATGWVRGDFISFGE